MQDMNLVKLAQDFGSDERCREYLEAICWPDGVKCPRCASDKVSRVVARHRYDCDSCRYQFSVTAGTVLHDTHLPLWKWFAAIYLMCESKKSISANQMKRTLSISYKTAWYLCHRIRAAMKEENPASLTGIVEVDETFIGGKARGKGRRYRGNKTLVVGAIERAGPARVTTAEHADRITLHGFIRTVASKATAIHTDDWPAYRGIGTKKRRHDTVNHSAKEWVRGDVHTNGIENVWSLFKRSVVGAYHQLSEKHMPAYLDEMSFRFNNRENPYFFRDTLIRLLATDPLPYRHLVSPV